MKVLIVGGGGREDALTWALSRSDRVTGIFCAPGNAGMAAIADCIRVMYESYQRNALDKDYGLTPAVEFQRERLTAGLAGLLDTIHKDRS